MVDTSTEAVTKLLDGVTPGPWSAKWESVDPDWGIVTTRSGAIVANINEADQASARFIAAARDLVPALLAERDALRKERDAAVEGWHVIHPNITVQDAAKVPEIAALIEAMDFALIRWDEHHEHGYNMQGDWVSDARAAIRAIAGGDA